MKRILLGALALALGLAAAASAQLPTKGNVFFGEDLMEIPFASPAASRLD